MSAESQSSGEEWKSPRRVAAEAAASAAAVAAQAAEAQAAEAQARYALFDIAYEEVGAGELAFDEVKQSLVEASTDHEFAETLLRDLILKQSADALITH